MAKAPSKRVELWGGPLDGSKVLLAVDAEAYLASTAPVAVWYMPIDDGDYAKNRFRYVTVREVQP
jgi:hypothetical protein